ncbi:MAG TPA: 1,2-phenylacetyl-CoA epoxidase subunit PaaD [Xanthomonadales bacterium]|nr:1,2-phenylacetyl-CoA epoxidase subunit PaaD [Xanthomonadales bacterium]
MTTAAAITPAATGRRQARGNPALEQLWDLLDQVKDPEIPVLTLWDLGILQDVEQQGDAVVVTITTTYSGCPAMDMIGDDIRQVLQQAGYANVTVRQRLSPAWTTDWISAEGRHKLREFGIAPPVEASGSKSALLGDKPIVPCPLCASTRTERVSEFGSTACKALYRCEDCRESFDYFKCI